MEIIHLKKADTESIYFALLECLKEKRLEISRIIGIDFHGASTFSGKKAGVHRRIKKIAPHTLFMHYHCHLLQFALVQAAKPTNGINHAYVMLTAQVLPLLSKQLEKATGFTVSLADIKTFKNK